MRKILTGFVSGVALLGLAACDGTDGTTTQGIDQDGTTQQAPVDGGAGGAGDAGGADPGTGTGTGAGGADTVQ